MKKILSEIIGTFWLVFAGCGSALLATGFPEVGIGWVGVSLAFGLAVLTGIYAFGPVSGAHFNPAVTIGLWTGGRIKGKDVLPYIISQFTGAVMAAVLLYIIITDNGAAVGSFAANGYGAASPGGYGMFAAILVEFVMTFMFVLIIMSVTREGSASGFPGLAIGFALVLVHLVSIPITNASVNPARSLSQALFAEGEALSQVWLFLVVPVSGAICAGIVHKYFFDKK